MNLEFERSDSFRSNYQRDLFLVLIWTLWVVLVTSLGWSKWFSFSGMGLIVLYGALCWNLTWAGFVFVWMGWIFSAISLTPAALTWLSLFISYLFLKLAQFRLEIRNAFQFAIAVGLASLSIELIQLLLLDRIAPGLDVPWIMYPLLISRALLQAGLGYLVWTPLQRWAAP